jgi:hypothetical protein
MYSKNFTECLNHDSFSKNWLRTSFLKQLLGKYTSPELDPDPDQVVKKGMDPGSGFPTLV